MTCGDDDGSDTPPVAAIRRVDYNEPRQQRDLITLLDMYARDPAGGGAALADPVRQTLPHRLAAWPTAVSLLAYVPIATAAPAVADGDDAERAVGLLNGFFGLSTFAARPLLNIHDLAVTPDWRGRGIGRQLLRAAEGIARERHCCKMTLEVLSGNTAARRVYQRCGFAGYRLDPVFGDALLLQKTL